MAQQLCLQDPQKYPQWRWNCSTRWEVGWELGVSGKSLEGEWEGDVCPIAFRLWFRQCCFWEVRGSDGSPTPPPPRQLGTSGDPEIQRRLSLRCSIITPEGVAL